MLDKLLKTDFPDILSNWGLLILWSAFFPHLSYSHAPKFVTGKATVDFNLAYYTICS